MFQPHVVLHPTDFSDSSAYAFRVASDIARQNHAILLIVHVMETLGPENVTYGEVASRREPDAYRERLEDEFRRSVPTPSEVVTQYVLAEGDPAAEIDRIARERLCELIVMGTHGRTGLSRLLMGSIAEQVVRRAPCPVLTCKLSEPRLAVTA